MKEIVVRSKKYGNQIALVDDSDFDLVNSHNWCVEKGKHTFYAASRRNNRVNN